ncbi:MAG: flagellar FlbD family protein [Candidatus Aminicenantes bacterium]|nr:flagellar FlbD family protein [Candidatus Aminicenantes bacterium]
MIRLFRLDGTEFLLNVDLISQVDSTPGTVISLLSGEKVEVKNTLTDVLTKIRASRKGSEDENREYDPEKGNPDRNG